MLYSHYSSYPIVRSSNKSHFIDNKLRLRDIKNCVTSKRSQNSMPMAMLTEHYYSVLFGYLFFTGFINEVYNDL